MSDATRILFAIDQCDAHGAEQLLPFVYDELRRQAGQRLAQEKPGQTLQATSLVHVFKRPGTESHQQYVP
jgi:hypothetical protein